MYRHFHQYLTESHNQIVLRGITTENTFDMLKAEKITLGVFDNNPSAYYCYKAAGFKEIPMKEDIVFEILGEKWKCIELEVNKERIT